MTTKRVKHIAAALTLVFVIALAFWVFSTPQSGVSAYSTDRRVKIYDVRYFASDFDYRYLSLWRQPQYQCQRLLRVLGAVKFPWKTVYPDELGGSGPALVIRGRISGGDSTKFDLVQEGMVGDRLAGVYSLVTNDFLWAFTVPSGGNAGAAKNRVFHLKHAGETNDLAIIRIR